MAALQNVPVARITERAREIRPGRVVMTIIAAILYAAGWAAWKTVAGTWLALAWSVTAVAVGWGDARAASRNAAGG